MLKTNCGDKMTKINIQGYLDVSKINTRGGGGNAKSK